VLSGEKAKIDARGEFRSMGMVIDDAARDRSRGPAGLTARRWLRKAAGW